MNFLVWLSSFSSFILNVWILPLDRLDRTRLATKDEREGFLFGFFFTVVVIERWIFSSAPSSVSSVSPFSELLMKDKEVLRNRGHAERWSLWAAPAEAARGAYYYCCCCRWKPSSDPEGCCCPHLFLLLTFVLTGLFWPNCCCVVVFHPPRADVSISENERKSSNCLLWFPIPCNRQPFLFAGDPSSNLDFFSRYLSLKSLRRVSTLRGLPVPTDI